MFGCAGGGYPRLHRQKLRKPEPFKWAKSAAQNPRLSQTVLQKNTADISFPLQTLWDLELLAGVDAVGVRNQLLVGAADRGVASALTINLAGDQPQAVAALHDIGVAVGRGAARV